MVVNSTKMSKTKVRSKADTTCSMEIFPCMNEICLSHSCSHLQLHECHASCLMLDRLFQLGYPLFWHFPCRFEALIYMERKLFFFLLRYLWVEELFFILYFICSDLSHIVFIQFFYLFFWCLYRIFFLMQLGFLKQNVHLEVGDCNQTTYFNSHHSPPLSFYLAIESLNTFFRNLILEETTSYS